MEGNGVRAVIMSLLILALVVAQIEAKSCCRNTTGRNCYNVCRLPGTPRPTCASLCGCKIITGTTCPNSYPRSSSEASVYQTTIITTTEFDEQDPSQSEKCRRQLSGMRMDNCKYYMFWPSSLLEQGCCKELERVNDPECKCEALRQRVPGYGQEQLQEAAMKVEGLADTCEMQELRSCQIRGQQEF